MSDINVDDFCKDAARALLILYRTFPRPHTLFVEDLCGPDRVDEFGMHSDRHVACFSTLLWLAEESFLRYVDTIRQEAVDQAVLTGRAFVLLSTPAAGSERLAEQTHAERLAQAVAERSSTRTRAAMLDLMRSFVGTGRVPSGGNTHPF